MAQELIRSPSAPDRRRLRHNPPHFDNIIDLPGQPGDVFAPDPSLEERGSLMSTYEEFMIILTAGLLIVAILNMKNKK